MEIKRITLYGAGLIGAGWLTHLIACGGYQISVYDLNQEALDKCRDRAYRDLLFLAGQDVITQKEADARMAEAVFTTDRRTALQDADLIQENGPENLELKRQILSDIEAECPPDAIICTSTSGIMVGSIAVNARHPGRVIGAHPYHPVYLLPLVEMIRGDKTSDDCMNTAYEFYKRIRKEPVILKKESPGYIASHLMSALMRECINLRIQGVGTMEDIDRAFVYGPGMRYALLGPFMVLQLAGGDGGIDYVYNGPIGQSSGSWAASFANWVVPPQEARTFQQNAQAEMNENMKSRDALHGRTNAEIAAFRDRALVELLKQHGKF